ncbi:hypothetical protein E6Q11_02550 [Candidatus Dojkabacteria bacterium]|uniref:Uncharacterized protein n=1 Tax=Candidatus Dojkabacteria bacterium TaxID=2099670 RepID=A0A5C7J7Z5_9BACT|nr:MAG: hypothetical protein E6Q11_02550 [Candidatus Dojkabacteria bacterium]
MPTYVLVSKMAGSPQIKISVEVEGLQIAIELEDFLKVLAKEAKNPSLLFTVNQLEARLLKASDAVVRSMKKETARVM